MKKILVIFVLIFWGISAQTQELKPGQLNLAGYETNVWGSYTISHMIFPNESWEFWIVIVPISITKNKLIEIAKDFYLKHPQTRARFFNDSQYIQQYIDRDIFVNDSTGTEKEVPFPDVKWVQDHLLGNINNRSSTYNRAWMLENRYGGKLSFL